MSSNRRMVERRIEKKANGQIEEWFSELKNLRKENEQMKKIAMIAGGVFLLLVMGIGLLSFLVSSSESPEGATSETGQSARSQPQGDPYGGNGEGLIDLSVPRPQREPPNININTSKKEKKDEGAWGFVKGVPILGPLAQIAKFLWGILTNPFSLIVALIILVVMSPIVGGIWWGFGRTLIEIWLFMELIWGGKRRPNRPSGLRDLLFARALTESTEEGGAEESNHEEQGKERRSNTGRRRSRRN